MAADASQANPNHWEVVAGLLTGFTGPTRADMSKITGSGGLPWVTVTIKSGQPTTVGANVDGHSYVLSYCGEPDGAWNKTYPKLYKICIDFVWGAGTGKHFGDSGDAGSYNWGYGLALQTLRDAHNTQFFKSGAYEVATGDAVDLKSFELVAKSFDKVGEFFKGHANTLATWTEALGKPDAAWQGNAAGLFRHLLEDLDTAYQGYDKQLHPAGWTATHKGIHTPDYLSTTRYGDSLIEAQNALHKCVTEMCTIWKSWIDTEKVEIPGRRSTFNPAGPAKAHYLQTTTLLYILEDLLKWIQENNLSKVQSTVTYSGKYSSTAHYNSSADFKSQTVWGNLGDTATWSTILAEAVKIWERNVEISLDDKIRIPVSTMNEVWKTVAAGTGGTAAGFPPATLRSLTSYQTEDNKKKELDDKTKKELDDKTKEKLDNDKKQDKFNKLLGGGGGSGSGGNGLKKETKNLGDGLHANPLGPNSVKNPDGSVTTRNPDGSTTTRNKDGSIVTRHPDGTVVTTFPDGRKTVTGPPHSLLPNNPNPLFPGGPGPGPRTVKNPDGSLTTYNPSDGSRSTKFPDGTTTTVAKDGTTTTATPDGSTTVLHKDGSETVTYPDGTRTTITKDGTSTTHFQDGSSTVHSKDGKLVTTDASGHSTVTRPAPGTVVHNPDGGTTTFNADGSTTSTHINGTKTTIDPGKGIVTTTDPGGTRTVSDLKDGTSTIRYADGSTAEVGTDGKVTTHYKDGSSTVLEPDGTLTTKDSSGSSSTTHLGASDGGSQNGGPTVQHGSDGSTTTTYQDGTVTKKLPDGTVTTTYRDGSTYTTAPDGRVTTTAALISRLAPNPLNLDRIGPVSTAHGTGSYTTNLAAGLNTGNSGATYRSAVPLESTGLPAGRAMTPGTPAQRTSVPVTTAEQAALTGGARPATTSSGAGGMPMMPPGGGGGGAPGMGTQSDERERVTWLSADEDVWGTDEGGAPAVIGR
ncbi:AAWKG family protein [Streptomyces sp. NPDC058304]|uniref:AAWKG family protein n=1 Tax=Streptomyces sp. NPDC058304 TaxID=3346437 RepID=UPI0036F09D45